MVKRDAVTVFFGMQLVVRVVSAERSPRVRNARNRHYARTRTSLTESGEKERHEQECTEVVAADL